MNNCHICGEKNNTLVTATFNGTLETKLGHKECFDKANKKLLSKFSPFRWKYSIDNVKNSI